MIPILTIRAKVLAFAKGESEKIKLLGAAEATAVEAVGRLVGCSTISSDCLFSIIFRAEAEQMRMKAAAYAQYGDAAVMSLVLEALPQVGCLVWGTVLCLLSHLRLLRKLPLHWLKLRRLSLLEGRTRLDRKLQS